MHPEQIAKRVVRYFRDYGPFNSWWEDEDEERRRQHLEHLGVLINDTLKFPVKEEIPIRDEATSILDNEG